MKIRLHNARILTMNEGEEIFLGEVHTDGSRITYVGPAIGGEGFDIERDCRGNLLMPGFKNAHTHSGMSVLRSLADDLPLNDWLREAIFPVEAKMTEEDIYHMSQLSALEYLTSGITACFDMYLTPQSVSKAMDDMGFRCCQTGAMNDFSQDIELLERMYLTGNQPDSLQSYIFGFHAEYTTCMDNMKAIAALAHRYEAPVYTHACETMAEVEGCKQRYGMTPVQLLDSVGLFDYGGGIYHGIYMTEADYDVMTRRGLYVVTNPGSNTKLASGIAPVTEYLQRGIPVAIGTDGPTSNNCLDFFREMFLVAGLAKLHDNDAAALDARQVLRMATVNGARAMHLNDCDVLAKGKKADIIMIDLWQPNMQPINNIEKNIVYSGSKQNVKMTMINGSILYEDNTFHCGVDPMDVYAKVEAIKQRICR